MDKKSVEEKIREKLLEIDEIYKSYAKQGDMLCMMITPISLSAFNDPDVPAERRINIRLMR